MRLTGAPWWWVLSISLCLPQVGQRVSLCFTQVQELTPISFPSSSFSPPPNSPFYLLLPSFHIPLLIFHLLFFSFSLIFFFICFLCFLTIHSKTTFLILTFTGPWQLTCYNRISIAPLFSSASHSSLPWIIWSHPTRLCSLEVLGSEVRTHVFAPGLVRAYGTLSKSLSYSEPFF